MPKRTKILSTRRAYEFGRDGLRLTMLSSPEVRQRIQQEFRFEVAQVGTPAPTFGAIPNSLPPGLIFDMGTVQLPAGVSMPIRFLHFEPFRVVIDAVGPSSGIDFVFAQIQRIVAEFETIDGSPMIDQPSRVVEYSEISAQLAFEFDTLVNKTLLEYVQSLTGGEPAMALHPVSISFQKQDGSNRESAVGYTLEIRGGTDPGDRIYFSAGNVSTDQHLAWLDSLEKELTAK